MIPIECPKCGRKGGVHPNQLNSRLVCKICHTVFHVDKDGHMVLGEPESKEPKLSKQPAEVAAAIEEFDLARTWNDIPKPARYGVPAVLLGAIAWMTVGGGEGAPPYVNQAESAVRALTSNNRSRTISHASSDTAEAAGKWFDLMHGELEKSQIGSNVTITPQLFSGNPATDGEITVMVQLSKPGPIGQPTAISLAMKKDGVDWLVDGNRCLASAESEAGRAKKRP